MIDEQTLKSWLRRIDEDGERALSQLAEPVNRFPDFVRYIVRQLKALCPTMGKVRIAQTLARTGLHLSATTVGRVLRERNPGPEDLEQPAAIASRRVSARNPGDLWHIDLTAVPTGAGFWVPWLPFTLPQRWPFCWWVLVVTDKGGQFRNPSWRTFCRTRGIRARYGATGRHGSIAVVERFIRAMKTECTTRVLVPLADETMRRELALYAVWCNEHRPHQAFDGGTPSEVLNQVATTHPGDAHVSDPVRLRVSYLSGRPHLPIVELQQAA